MLSGAFAMLFAELEAEVQEPRWVIGAVKLVAKDDGSRPRSRHGRR
jgi:hypothetical protein